MTFTNVIALPAALSVSLLGVFDEGQQLVSVCMCVVCACVHVCMHTLDCHSSIVLHVLRYSS